MNARLNALESGVELANHPDNRRVVIDRQRGLSMSVLRHGPILCAQVIIRKVAQDSSEPGVLSIAAIRKPMPRALRSIVKVLMANRANLVARAAAALTRSTQGLTGSPPPWCSHIRMSVRESACVSFASLFSPFHRQRNLTGSIRHDLD